jgi:DNA-binding XRE family transcriptional regulator
MDQMATDIGSRLRQARERRGLTLRDIATTTKISMTALAAIEDNLRPPSRWSVQKGVRAGVRGRGGLERRRARARVPRAIRD